jgi:hypothetical protein
MHAKDLLPGNWQGAELPGLEQKDFEVTLEDDKSRRR